MSVKAFPESPLFHEMFTKKDLERYVSTLNTSEVKDLESEIYSQAIADGVEIPDGDREWGKHHLYDNASRLVHIIFEKKKKEWVQAIGPQCSVAKIHLIADHCPLFLKNILKTKPHLNKKIVQRVELISRLEHLYDGLCTKYPGLFYPRVFSSKDSRKISSEDSKKIKSAWKRIETYYLNLPTSLSVKDAERFQYLTSVIEEICNGNYDEVTVQIILERLLRKESFHPTQADLANALRVKSIGKMTTDQVNNRALQTAAESSLKSIYIIPSSEDKQGKFKPLTMDSARKEVYATEIDRLCGLGMTAPTGLLITKNFSESLLEVKELFNALHLMRKKKNVKEAGLLRQRAFLLFNQLPKEAIYGIFGEMYALSGKGQKIKYLGEKLFYNTDGYKASDREKAVAIQNYLNSEAFKYHAHVFNVQGSVQTWIDHCGRCYDLIVKDPTGGEKLKTAPKALVHVYALLGIIKGSMDCHSGNTFIEYRPELNRVVNFWDFDDERSMPAQNHFKDLRMWQMGLPQSAEPFDRAVLLMFLDPHLKEKFMKQQTSSQIPQAAYEAQLERLGILTAAFQEELDKEEITLTPRDLFFKIFGGRNEFYRIKSHFNNDKSYGEEGIRISPIEIFEFHLASMGNGYWYTSNEYEKTLVGRNMRALYSPHLP